MAALPSGSIDPHEFLICGICAEPYDDDTHTAKFLICHHTFCSDCLTKLSKREQVLPGVIQCPNCRSDTQLPEDGVNGLQTNFYIASVQEISKNIEPARAAAYYKGCHGHNMQPESYFCMTCGIVVCCECATDDHKAKNGHSVISISKSEIGYLQELNFSHTSLTRNKRKLEHIESEMTLLTAAKKNALKEMNTFTKHCHEQLEQRSNDLNCQIMAHFNAQQNALLDKQNQIKGAIEIINKNKNQAKVITKTGDVGKLKPICESLKEVNEKTQSILSKMDLGENNFAFDKNKGFDAFKECLTTLGDIHGKGSLPTMMRFKNVEAKVGFKSVLTVEVYNHHGDKLSMTSGSFSVQVIDPTGTKIHTDLCTTGPACTVIFTPKTRGLHQICGFFLGQKLISEQTHISVSGNSPVLKFGKKGNGNGTLESPHGVAIDNDGVLYVADQGNRLIQKFSGKGEFLSQFSVNGHNEDCTTLDVALDLNNGLIYCTDIVYVNDDYSAGNNMLVFNLDGNLQHIHNLGGVSYPISIAINSHGGIFISDITKKCIYKVDKEGNTLFHVGDFAYPSHITIADDDSIIVLDNKRECIYIFNPDGSIRHKFGSSGSGKGQLKEPWGVATDGENILVADGGNKRIQVFKMDGTFVSIIASDDDPLQDPTGLAVTKDGYVYVADCEKNCIQKYKYQDMIH